MKQNLGTEESRKVQQTIAGPGGVRADPTYPDGVQQSLRELVQRFHVCFEVLADNYFVGKEIRQTGFTLELTGTHEQGVEHPLPGCQHCHNVRIALHEIAKWIVPKERRDTDHDIVPFDQSIHYDAERKFRPEVSLRIWIRHRSGFDRPVDACEVRCLNEMKGLLKKLGVRDTRWDQDKPKDFFA
jgi:hypothetical protein